MEFGDFEFGQPEFRQLKFYSSRAIRSYKNKEKYGPRLNFFFHLQFEPLPNLPPLKTDSLKSSSYKKVFKYGFGQNIAVINFSKTVPYYLIKILSLDFED